MLFMVVGAMLDPLQIYADLPLRALHHPLGFPVEIATNSADVLASATESWGLWTPAFEVEPVTLRILVHDADGFPPDPGFRGQRHLTAIVADAANFAVCDGRTLFGFCSVSRAAAANREWFRWYFLDAMAYTLLCQRYVTAVHAACVSRNGRGVLVCGPSGAGKSTLAYACARAGWTLVSDDSVCLFDGQVIGKPYHIRLRPAAPFPELPLDPPAQHPNGKPSIELATAALGIATAARCQAGAVVLLNRRPEATPSLAPVDPETMLLQLSQDLPAYEPDIQKRHDAALRALTALPAFELTYREYPEALECLDRL